MRRKWTYQQGRKPERPPIDAELERWILRVAKANPGLGYEKLAGELRKLAIHFEDRFQFDEKKSFTQNAYFDDPQKRYPMR